MSFRRAIIALLASAAAVPLAAAQEARQVDIAYEITFGGIAGFRIDVTARFNGTSYDVESTTFKEGMLKAVTMNYFGRNRAWGGFSSLKHVTRYIQPGLELIALDPKRSTSVIGKEAFENDATMRDVARRLATDIGAMNQVGCVNSRVSYLMTGTDDHGIKTIILAADHGQGFDAGLVKLAQCQALILELGELGEAPGHQHRAALLDDAAHVAGAQLAEGHGHAEHPLHGHQDREESVGLLENLLLAFGKDFGRPTVRKGMRAGNGLQLCFSLTMPVACCHLF